MFFFFRITPERKPICLVWGRLETYFRRRQTLALKALQAVKDAKSGRYICAIFRCHAKFWVSHDRRVFMKSIFHQQLIDLLVPTADKGYLYIWIYWLGQVLSSPQTPYQALKIIEHKENYRGNLRQKLNFHFYFNSRLLSSSSCQPTVYDHSSCWSK